MNNNYYDYCYSNNNNSHYYSYPTPTTQLILRLTSTHLAKPVHTNGCPEVQDLSVGKIVPARIIRTIHGNTRR